MPPSVKATDGIIIFSSADKIPKTLKRGGKSGLLLLQNALSLNFNNLKKLLLPYNYNTTSKVKY